MQDSRDALVSVIIPCYRCSSTIERAITSIALQTQKPAEVILVDDASDDDSLGVLRALEQQYFGWIKVVSLPVNAGAASARNAGWEIASQPYIAFLDSDDAWHPRKIEIQYAFMKDNSDVVLSGHAFMQIHDKGSVEGVTELSREDDVFYEVSKNRLLLSNCFSTPSVMLCRDITQRFPCGKRYGEDYHLWMEICSAGLKCYRNDHPLTFLYKNAYGKSGLSAALWKMEKGELDVYLNLFKKNYIFYPTLLLLFGWSLVKFLRRVINVALLQIDA